MLPTSTPICPQGSELAGWALGRYSYEGIDMNHNFADLNSVMWTAIELETDRSKLINHYFPIPEQYTSEDAFVSFIRTRDVRPGFKIGIVSATIRDIPQTLKMALYVVALLSSVRMTGTF